MSTGPRVTVRHYPDRALESLQDIHDSISGDAEIMVGFPRGSNGYPEDGTSVIDVAVTHEFGDRENNIPQRSFLRSTFAENRRHYLLTLLPRYQRKVYRGEMTMDRAMGLMGQKIANDVKTKILAIRLPPNSADTIARKRSNNPLINTGHLRRTVTHVIRPRRGRR